MIGRVTKILELFRETESVIRDLPDSAEQRLRLGISYTMMQQIIPVVFPSSLQTLPEYRSPGTRAL